jgi:hypothetical protein
MASDTDNQIMEGKSAEGQKNWPERVQISLITHDGWF